MDTSFLVGNAPQPLLNPLDIQAKRAAIQNALANNALLRQEQQKNALAIQSTQRQMAADAAFRALFNSAGATPDTVAPSVAPASAPMSVTSGAPPASSFDPTAAAPNLSVIPASAPASVGSPDVPPAAASTAAAAAQSGNAPTAAHDISDDQILGIYGQAGYGLIHARNEANKLAAEAKNTRAEAQAKVNDYFGSLAFGLKSVGYDPGAVQAALMKAKADGMQGTPEFQMFAQNYQSPQAVAQLAEQAIANSPEQQKLLNERTTAAAETAKAKADQQNADTNSDRRKQEVEDKKKADLGAALGGASNQAEWTKIISQSDPALVASLAIPPAFSKANQQAVVAKASEQGRHDLQQEANERAARSQEQQNINLRQRVFNQQYGDPTEGATPAELATAKARAAGTLPLPSPRSKGYDREFALAVAQDPTFAQFASTRADTIKNFKEKGDSNDVVALATALEHLDRAKTNSAAMGFEPTIGTNMFPDQHRYRQDVYNLTDEVGKLIKSGVVPEAEGKRAIDNLMSAFQSNRDAGIDELKNLMGGKVAAKIQKYVTGTGQLVPASMFDAPTQARLKSAGFANGIDWQAQASPSPGAPGAGTPGARPSLADIFGAHK